MEPLRPKDPKSIGPYTLIGRLGAGGMGIVYLASKGSESVALKVVRESLIDDPSDATRFTREIEALEAIDSPFVAKILGSGVDKDQAWFATEFVNGPDLKSLVSDKGPLDEDKWQVLADGLLKGLEAIHTAGVIHRDIKPGNIIMSETGPKIIDFGIAQVSDATSVTSSGLVAGSPAWFSPEQIEGQVLTSATDLFSAGSVLVYAATGSSPWGDETTITKASVFKILTAEPNLEGLSADQRNLVDSLMAKEPEDRGTGNTQSSPKKTRKTSSPIVESTQTLSPKKPKLKMSGWSRKKVALAVIGVLALAAASIGVVHLIPASGRLSVYQHSTYQSSNPVLGDLILTIQRDSRLPIEIPLSSDRDYKFADTTAKFEDVGEWDSSSEFRIALTSSFAQDPVMETEFFVSEFGISGLIQNPEIGIQIYISDDEFEVAISAPQLSGGTAEFVRFQSTQFKRGNEREALAACKNSNTESFKRKFSEARSLVADWNAAYYASPANSDGSYTMNGWAWRYADFKKEVTALRDAVDANSPRGIDSRLDSELSRVLDEANRQITVIQDAIDYMYGHVYNFTSEDFWAQTNRARDTPTSFSGNVINEVAEDLCGQEIY